ncbi:DNA (cytosine-5)-methyltransferase 1 [Streptacidiphilus sp. MAP12-16]|uniref:DNA cytosine methyltransferase n=1 Tax=Streptacidiphilus sp. MAP12-16 TaxID=3156300 RepID=UPI003511E412
MALRRMRIGSLCTGVGALELAALRVFPGSELVWVADSDKDAARVLAHRWTNTRNLGDITAVDWLDVPEVDALLTGPPCQPFSLAGKRRGTDDPRHLWPHIAAAVGVLRPPLLVLEEVPGFITLGLHDALASLALLGYRSAWGVVAAAQVGAPHLRRRLFLGATPDTTPAAHTPGLGRRAATDPAQPLPIGGPSWPLAGGGGRRACLPRAVAADPACLRRHQGLPEPALQQRTEPGLGSRLGGQAAADPTRLGQRYPGTQGHPGIPPAAVPGRPTPPTPATGVDWGEYAPAIQRWERVLGRAAPAPADEHRRLRPEFVEFLMSLPEGHVTSVDGISRAAMLRLLGGSVVVEQAVLALQLLLRDLAGPFTDLPDTSIRRH